MQIVSPEQLVLSCDVCVLKNPRVSCPRRHSLWFRVSALFSVHLSRTSFIGTHSLSIDFSFRCHNLIGLDALVPGQNVCSRKRNSVIHKYIMEMTKKCISSFFATEFKLSLKKVQIKRSLLTDMKYLGSKGYEIFSYK